MLSPFVQRFLAAALVANLPSEQACAETAARWARRATVVAHRTLSFLATGEVAKGDTRAP